MEARGWKDVRKGSGAKAVSEVRKGKQMDSPLRPPEGTNPLTP